MRVQITEGAVSEAIAKVHAWAIEGGPNNSLTQAEEDFYLHVLLGAARKHLDCLRDQRLARRRAKRSAA